MKRLLSALLALCLLLGAAWAEEAIVAEEEVLTIAEEEPAWEEIFESEEELAPEEALEEAEETEALEEPVSIEESLEEAVLKSGTWGTCDWNISDRGVLTIHAGTGANTGSISPWRDHANLIKSVVATERIVLPEDSSFLLSLFGYDSGNGAYQSACTSMKLAGFVTSNVRNMEGMFYGCSVLKTLDISSFSTARVTNMKQMFSHCESLTSLAPAFSTANVTDMSSMFGFCNALKTLDLSTFSTAKVTDLSFMFNHCIALESLNLSGFDPANATNLRWMFYDCNSLKSLNLSGFRTPKAENMSYMFGFCTSLTSLNVSGLDTRNVTDMSGMFANCEVLPKLDLSNFSTARATNMNSMFNMCFKLASLNISSFSTANVTDMSYMFFRCESLTSLNVSGFRTGKVTTMRAMFYECKKMPSLNLSSFDTRNVTDMSEMFDECIGLTRLDLSGFQTPKLQTAAGMFYLCRNLEELDVHSFVTPALSDCHAMFGGCGKLALLDLSGLNTRNVTAMKNMFAGCDGLIQVSLGSNFTFKGSGSSVLCTLPEGWWYSKQSSGGYEAQYLAENRNNRQDTYVRLGTPVIKGQPVDTNAARITWPHMEGIDGYQLWRSDNGGAFQWVKNNTTDAVNNYSLTPGANYQYKVRAYIDLNNGQRIYGDFSNIVSVHILGTIDNFTVTGKDTNCAFLKWKKVEGCTGYQVFRKVEGSGDFTWVKNATTNQVANYALTPDTTYYYKVRAYIDLPDGKRAYGQYSEGVKVYIQPQVVIQKLVGGSGRITLTWSKAEGCTGYQIFCTEAGTGGDYAWVRNVPAGQLSVTVPNLKAKTDYWFKIRSYVELPNGERYYGQYSEAKHTWTK